VYNGLIAPGQGYLDLPVLSDPKCPYPGYSLCALAAYRTGDGTSFSAPLVSAAAALLLAQRPTMTASQAMKVLQSSATDLGKAGRDAATGEGLLNVEEALRQATTAARSGR
jgi:subtilisin family serine protease